MNPKTIIPPPPLSVLVLVTVLALMVLNARYGGEPDVPDSQNPLADADIR